MTISFQTEAGIDISFYWYGTFTLNKSNPFFLSSNRLDIKKAKELETMFPDLFEYKFYTECNIDKVIIIFKFEGTVISIK